MIPYLRAYPRNLDIWQRWRWTVTVPVRITRGGVILRGIITQKVKGLEGSTDSQSTQYTRTEIARATSPVLLPDLPRDSTSLPIHHTYI